MATYKAEFLSHYYQGRLRPRAAYSMGLIFRWARLAALAPALVNLTTRAPGLSGVAKWLGGIAPQREIPAFARQTFRAWFQRRAPRNVGHEQVILWPDTFTNSFEPEIGQAAVEVLEAAGYHVTIPDRALCCGRPLYDFGMLATAERQLRQTLDALRPQIQAGTPLIGLEPSCLAVFRDELVSLFPEDNDAARLAQQSYLLSEFLHQKAPAFALPKLRRRALVHGHCHHKAIMTMEAENAILDRLGLDYEEPETGCCGMAGSFGFERAGEKYDVSIKCGERVLLPAVRAADAETLIITDGFSCRQQIGQGTHRRALHLAQVLQMALREGDQPARPYPENGPLSRPLPHGRRGVAVLAAAGAGAALAGGALAWGARQTRPR
jgi:Fe-S oxidoreductase